MPVTDYISPALGNLVRQRIVFSFGILVGLEICVVGPYGLSRKKQAELRDPGFWREYFYWSWRCLLFVVVATNFDYREGIVDSFDHISPTKWTVFIVIPPLIGPAFVAGWSYLWTWGRDLLKQVRR